jgi:hypothetical protein
MARWWVCDCGQASPESQDTCGHCGAYQNPDDLEPATLAELGETWFAFFREKLRRKPKDVAVVALLALSSCDAEPDCSSWLRCYDRCVDADRLACLQRCEAGDELDLAHEVRGADTWVATAPCDELGPAVQAQREARAACLQ